MIIAESKSLDEVKQLLGSAQNVLVVGCGTCVTVCLPEERVKLPSPPHRCVWPPS